MHSSLSTGYIQCFWKKKRTRQNTIVAMAQFAFGVQKLNCNAKSFLSKRFHRTNVFTFSIRTHHFDTNTFNLLKTTFREVQQHKQRTLCASNRKAMWKKNQQHRRVPENDIISRWKKNFFFSFSVLTSCIHYLIIVIQLKPFVCFFFHFVSFCSTFLCRCVPRLGENHSRGQNEKRSEFLCRNLNMISFIFTSFSLLLFVALFLFYSVCMNAALQTSRTLNGGNECERTRNSCIMQCRHKVTISTNDWKTKM